MATGIPLQSAIRESQPAESSNKTCQRVVRCYRIFDKFYPRAGMLDYTEGIYEDENTTYEQAQSNQYEYLLDQAVIRRGSRLLEIGCGNGSLLRHAKLRNARALGITISPEQVKICKKQELNAQELDYKNIDSSWNNRFDSVIANGSPEHFVQPEDVIAGRDDAMYRQLFKIAHRMIDPQSPSRRFVNTTIHRVRPSDPRDWLANPFKLKRMSDAYHFSLLNHSFGGWYPELGQFERAAQGYFRLVDEVDGTDDYRRTSEEWLSRMRPKFRSLSNLKTWLLGSMIAIRHPIQFRIMWHCMIVGESWNWQFRGKNPPTRLLRQTWEYVER